MKTAVIPALLTALLCALVVSFSSKTYAEPPQKKFEITTHGVKAPLERNIQWTAYYITPVKRAEAGKGQEIVFTDLEGNEIIAYLTNRTFRSAEMEAVGVGIDKYGKKRFAYRTEKGHWKELPKGSKGMGNRLNPLVPFRHVAADNSRYPYGSMFYTPDALGVEVLGSKPMDGFFWVSDSGGLIKGDHFDLFAGDEEVYNDLVHGHHGRYHISYIYKIPTPTRGLNPLKEDELASLLVAAGRLAEDEKDDAGALQKALIGFQKTVPYIPDAEYGNPTAATTLWFLVQLGLEQKK